MNSRTTNPSLDYAFAPLNNWFRCSGLEATERRGADRRSGIAFPHNRFRRHRHRRLRRVRLPPSRSPPVLPASQTGLRARTCGWYTGRLRGDCGVMCCFSFITILNPSCQIRPRPIHHCRASTIFSETPGTFVRARTRKGGEIRKGKGKGAPVWTNGLVFSQFLTSSVHYQFHISCNKNRLSRFLPVT